ncbi:xylulose kinase-like protein [Leptotrombidium deliense]|uniref:Xylulose kinase n=1 Tax=Leptotrombidium deliense TaxID=299467 RepID=A0A443SUL9_9ACAR|nr:xylulose kinase-like protein [Leptotrombidium deliense]
MGDTQCRKSYLGFDFSTQQLKAVAVNDTLEVISEATVHFDSELPEFRTVGGVNRHEKSHVVTACPLMWIKALDLVIEKLKITGFDLSTVQAISGCGQQHGSVYWKKGANEVLKNLDPNKFLHTQLQDVFSIRESPVWMDSSTTKQCKQLEDAVGGPENLATITGSRAYERFTGSQIAKIFQTRQENYMNTERISLISSFAASLFLGDYAAIDFSDGSGMNLLDINTRQWHQACLDACAPNLSEKLGEPVSSSHILGFISAYFVERYGFREDCRVVAFTGDNPASLVGTCLNEGDMTISLGTGDTLFVWLPHATSTLNGHVFINPLNDTQFMGMICYKNGSRTRERLRDQCAESSWHLFSELLNSTPRGNFGNIGFYFDFREIYPLKIGDYRFNKFNQRIARFSNEVEVRACVEGQFLRFRVHAHNLGFELSNKTRIIATGGASCNQAILQVAADIFNANVYTSKQVNSACLGAAFMAKYGKCHKKTSNSHKFLNLSALVKDEISFSEMVSEMSKIAEPLSTTPAKDANVVYFPMVQRYKQIEDELNTEN